MILIYFTGYYLYIAPSGQASSDQVAKMVGPVYSTAAADCEFIFWYVMSGKNVGGMMLVLVDTTDNSETLLWHNSADTGDEWQQMRVGIGRRTNSYKVSFCCKKDAYFVVWQQKKRSKLLV